MRIEIEIPKEFEEHFKQDKFEDTLHRLSADAHLIAGNYEQETAIMLIKAFADSKPAYDLDKVVAELEEEKEIAEKEMEECIFKALPYHDSTEGKVIGIKKAIDIVKRGGVE